MFFLLFAVAICGFHFPFFPPSDVTYCTALPLYARAWNLDRITVISRITTRDPHRAASPAMSSFGCIFPSRQNLFFPLIFCSFPLFFKGSHDLKGLSFLFLAGTRSVKTCVIRRLLGRFLVPAAGLRTSSGLLKTTSRRGKPPRRSFVCRARPRGLFACVCSTGAFWLRSCAAPWWSLCCRATQPGVWWEVQLVWNNNNKIHYFVLINW